MSLFFGLDIASQFEARVVGLDPEPLPVITGASVLAPTVDTDRQLKAHLVTPTKVRCNLLLRRPGPCP
jgi:hypothetical protein